MASTVLPNGIIVPEKFSRDWYADLYHNWQELDNLLGGGTPKDGTLTIQKNGDTVGTFSANQSTDETINIEVPDVNDGTLTIQQNGTTVDTFTANSSTDKTVNIQCVDLSSNQTVGGNKEFTGTTTAHDLVPSATDTYNFGSPSYQWNNAYIKSLTINGVACGDILTHNASEFAYDADVVHKRGNETLTNGDKTFDSTASLRIQGCNKGNEFSSNARTVLELRSNRDTADKSCIYITKFRQNRAQGSMGGNDNVILTMDVLENEVRTNDLLRFTAYNWINDIPTEMYLEPPTKASNIRSFLGSSSRPWGNTTTNALNGLNPGALSLPSGTVGMNLIGDVSVVGTEKKLSKDITVTGYVYVDVSFTSSNRLNLYNDTKKYGIWVPCDSGKICQIMPISAGDRLEFNVLDNGSTINAIQLFTCQGNV